MVGIDEPWPAYQFDCAVTTVGLGIESALQEYEKVGDDYKPKYDIEQILQENFRLPTKQKANVEVLHKFNLVEEVS